MRLRYYYIVAISIIGINIIQGQDNIQELTLGITDSSKTQIEQAKDIYHWITSNISFDAKSYNKGLHPNLSPTELIRQRKGLSSDYTQLFEEMCSSIGIEAYTIKGYSKDYLFNNQKPFLKGNHNWNVIYADSTWIHVDPTWGSGSLTLSPAIRELKIGVVLGTPMLNSKFSFVKVPNNKHFNIRVDSLQESHYPIDPKWLFTESPITLETFIKDSGHISTSYSLYEREIEKIRHKSSITQRIEEGKNAFKYNKYNHFDLAQAKHNESLTYVIEKEVNEDNLWQFENYAKDFNLIVNSIDKHLEISDSVYRARKKMLRQVSRTQKRLTGKIKNKTKKAKDTHKSSQKQIVGKNSSYNKKIGSYMINIGRAEIRKIPLGVRSEMQYKDTSEVLLLFTVINDLREEQPFFDRKLDSLLNDVDNFAVKDAKLDDSISSSNRLFKTNIDALWLMILSGNEEKIVGYVDSLQVIYSDIESLLSSKKLAKSDLQKTGREFYNYSGLLQKSLKQEMSLNSKLQKLTLDADSVVMDYNSAIDELISTYRKSIVFTKRLAKHNSLQADIRDYNLEALKQQKKSIRKENKFFIKWYDNHTRIETEDFVRDKELSKQIRKTAFKNLKIVEMKIDKFRSDQSN